MICAAADPSGAGFPVGESAALATSLSWALCSLGFAAATRRVGALAVNQIRIVIAVLALLVAHRLTQGVWFPLEATTGQIGWLAVSGWVGLTLGDWCYFHCIGALGPRIGTLLMATWPVPCSLLAWPLLGEPLGAGAGFGMLLVIGGVAVVLLDPRGGRGWEPGRASGSRRLAIVAGLLGALGQASGLVLAKLGMVGGDGVASVAPLSATLVRMSAAAVGALLAVVVSRRVGTVCRALRDGKAMAATMFGVTFGPTLGVYMSLVAVEHTRAGVAATLMSLPPVFMLPISAIAYGARPGPWAVLGTLIAFSGTAVLFLY